MVSRASGDVVARATNRAAMVSWWALLGASRPTDSHRGPSPALRREGGEPPPGPGPWAGAARWPPGSRRPRHSRPARSSSASNSDTPMPSAAVGARSAQLEDGRRLVPGDPVVPGREVLGRRDAVVVDDDRLGPACEPAGHVRPGGHLVHEHVARFGVVLVLEVVAGSRRRCPGRASRCRSGTRRRRPPGGPAASGCARPPRRARWSMGTNRWMPLIGPTSATTACTLPARAVGASRPRPRHGAPAPCCHVSGCSGRPGSRSRTTGSRAASHAAWSVDQQDQGPARCHDPPGLVDQVDLAGQVRPGRRSRRGRRSPGWRRAGRAGGRPPRPWRRCRAVPLPASKAASRRPHHRAPGVDPLHRRPTSGQGGQEAVVAQLPHQHRQVGTGRRPGGGRVHPGRAVDGGQVELGRPRMPSGSTRRLEAVDPGRQEPDGVERRSGGARPAASAEPLSTSSTARSVYSVTSWATILTTSPSTRSLALVLRPRSHRSAGSPPQPAGRPGDLGRLGQAAHGVVEVPAQRALRPEPVEGLEQATLVGRQRGPWIGGVVALVAPDCPAVRQASPPATPSRT